MTQRVATWNHVGYQMNTKDIDEAMKISKLDFEVVSRPIKYRVGDKYYEVKGRVANIQKDSPENVFGIVSSSYKIVQNREAFDFVSSIDEDMHFINGGITRGGMVYLIGQLGEIEVLGDKIRPHLIFVNGHNGYITLKSTICMLRLVCQNQFNYSFKNAANTINIRHNGGMQEKLANAKKILQGTRDYIRSYKNMAEDYCKVKIDNHQLQKIISEMFIDGNSLDEVHDPRGHIERTVNDFMKAYHEDDNQNFIGTAWGVVNAFTDVATHLPPKKKSENYKENLFINNTLKSNNINKLIGLIDNI